MNQPNSSNYQSTEYLHINSCGVQGRTATGYTTARPNGRVDYHLLYVQSGTIYIEQPEALALEAGSLYFYPPHVPQRYSFRQGEPVNSYWLHFSGTGCRRLLSACGVTKQGAYHIANTSSFQRLFEQLLHEYYTKSPATPLHARRCSRTSSLQSGGTNSLFRRSCVKPWII